MQFILEIDKEKQIQRKTLQSNGKDFEDDAQHAWHMAIMTLLLSEYANEEIDALNDILPTETAVVDVKFKEQLKGVTEGYKDSLSTIQLTSYEPNRLVYKASTPKDGVVVFSEIYYPGWQATIDGQPVDIARADYVLRVMNIPAGEHTIEMWFDPQSIHVTESIAYAALALLLIGVMILVWMSRSRISKKS